MTQNRLLLPVIALLAATPALAQETETPAEEAPAAEAEAATPEAETEEAPQTPVGGDLDLGQGDAPQQPQPYIRETFQDWSLQCVAVQGQEDEVCQMYQLLTDEQGSPVAEVSMFKLQGGGQAVAGGTFIVPLETLLPQKLSVSVDGAQAKRYDYSFCAQAGCYARIGLTSADVAQFKAGAKAEVTIVPALAPNQKVTVPMSLSGFTAAYEATSALRP
ncbi:invasion associated locus B family protein [Sagittula sp. SSi028]|uniref:invasion associated locus B family protein n=1 Tax=Sagittula sp. SSi028 TaxID=3400636 RepID=UPI003AF702FE